MRGKPGIKEGNERYGSHQTDARGRSRMTRAQASGGSRRKLKEGLGFWRKVASLARHDEREASGGRQLPREGKEGTTSL